MLVKGLTPERWPDAVAVVEEMKVASEEKWNLRVAVLCAWDCLSLCNN